MVGVIRAPGRDDRIVADRFDLIRRNFRRWVGQREHDWTLGHAGDHLAGHQPAAGQAQHDVRSDQRIAEVTGRSVLSEGRFVRVDFTGLETGLGDDALAVAHRDVLRCNAARHVVVRAGNGAGSGANDDHLDVLNGFALQLACVDERGRRDDGGAVLVVVHHWNVGGLGDASLNFEAFGGLDVLEVDAAKGLRNGHHGVDEALRIRLVNLDVKHVNVGEGLQEQPLSFHDRFAGQGADVAETKHGCTVRDHGHQVALRRVAVGVLRPLCDFQTGIRHARRIRQ